jgi:hypothetical protein
MNTSRGKLMMGTLTHNPKPHTSTHSRRVILRALHIFVLITAAAQVQHRTIMS